MRTAQRPSRPAFSLLELIAVLVVLAVIAGVVGPRFFDISARARASSEAAAVAAVRGGVSQAHINASVNGGDAWPASLDSHAPGTVATSAAPFFTSVLSQGVGEGWTKGSTAFSYISASGDEYVYDPATGQFDTPANVAAYALALGASGAGGAGAPPSGPPPITFTAAATWTAAGAAISGFIGAGYALAGDEVMLTDASPGLTESARRVALAGGQDIEAGTYTLDLDTKLDDYWSQLNYWIVIGVKSGTQLNLSGDTLRWNATYPGVKYLHQDYAPPEKSNGAWYTYNSTFTVSAADAAEYDQIVVVMAGSTLSGQTLGWRNVSLRKN